MLLPAQPLPGGITPPSLLASHAEVFLRRANRLTTLAEHHPFGDWLRWLAAVCEAQHESALQCSPLQLVPAQLTPDAAIVTEVLPKVLQSILATLAQRGQLDRLPALQQTPLLNTAELAPRSRACHALAIGDAGGDPRDARDILVAAAMQVVWTTAARSHVSRIEPAIAQNSAQCPICGAAPHASIVLAGEGKAGLRYLECSLCASRWNTVRARCTLCDAGPVVNYLGLEGYPAIQAETCDACHGYIKTFFQDKDIAVEPLADDLASLALDVLVGEQGYGRGAPNLLIDSLQAE